LAEERVETSVSAQQKRTAVAIRYDVDKDRAPIILATGNGPIADEIKRIAEDNSIPLYENKELSELLSKLELETEIPADLYVLVAEVLFFVFSLDKMAAKREKLMKKMVKKK